MSDEPFDFRIEQRRISAGYIITAVRPKFEDDDPEMVEARVKVGDEIREFLKGNVARQEGFAYAYDYLRGVLAILLTEPIGQRTARQLLDNFKSYTAYVVGETEVSLVEAITGEPLVVESRVDAATTLIDSLLDLLESKQAAEAPDIGDWADDGLDPEDA